MTTRAAAAVAAAADAAAVVAFAALGRSSHAEGVTAVGTLQVAAPFLVAGAAGWAAARAWRRPAALETGAVVWAVTVAGGMFLRAGVFDRGTAPSFVVVAALTLGVFLLGWRLVARAGARVSPAARRPG